MRSQKEAIVTPTPKPMPPHLKNQGEPAITSAGQKQLDEQSGAQTQVADRVEVSNSKGFTGAQNLQTPGASPEKLLILGRSYLAAKILQLLTVRIHSAICEKGHIWARLWYLLRAFDIQGSGCANIPMAQICQLLGVSSSTVYEWLRKGREVSAFTWYRVSQRQGLRVRLGSLHRVCKTLGLIDSQGSKISSPWGVVAQVPLHEAIVHLRALATAAVTQKLQSISHWAAWRSLPAAARKTYKLPQPQEFFQSGITGATSYNRTGSPEQQASQSVLNRDEEQRRSYGLPAGRIRCLLHVGSKRIFVSKGFNPFGTSQPAIARERGYCDRTIQRQVKALKVPHRQIVQAKAAYGKILQAINHDADSCQPEENISWKVLEAQFDGSGVLTDQSGTVGKTHSVKVKPERFFSYGGKNWIYRCNIYQPTLKLCTMRRSLSKYRQSVLQKSSVAGGTTCCSEEVLKFSEPAPT